MPAAVGASSRSCGERLAKVHAADSIHLSDGVVSQTHLLAIVMTVSTKLWNDPSNREALLAAGRAVSIWLRLLIEQFGDHRVNVGLDHIFLIIVGEILQNKDHLADSVDYLPCRYKRLPKPLPSMPESPK